MDTDLHFKAGDRLVVGDKVITLDEGFVSQMNPGDKLLAVSATGSVKRIPAAVSSLVDAAMTRALLAFRELSHVSSESVSLFFDEAARLLEDTEVAGRIVEVNNEDVSSARSRGRSTTRLEFTEKMRDEMVAAFRMWRDSDVSPEVMVGEVAHQGWTVEQWKSPLGVIGFVFEGRPNVFADATGVIRSGNTVVFRIGSDALRTAKAIMSHVVAPALKHSGLPEDCVVLLESPEHASGWCLFSDSRLALAVARGSGEAVSELGSIARQSGVSVSLHGTGGAWMLVGESADLNRLRSVITHSLDRKVCNTLNVLCIPRTKAADFVPLIAEAAETASAKRKTRPRFHAVNGAEKLLPSRELIEVERAAGISLEEQVTISSATDLGSEFEWEQNPEFFVVLVEDTAEAIGLFNKYSPQFVVSVISEDPREREMVWKQCNAPFMGDGFTRWVDGQFALLRPELGLSNWEGGRLFARGGVLSGDSAFTVRLKVRQDDIDLHR
jgi:glutamate-5-semialdehyde dehydrogenase